MKVFAIKDAAVYRPGDTIIPSEVIEQRMQEVAEELAKKWKSKQLLVIGLLKGAAWITLDLFTKLYQQGVTDTELTFMTVKSYSDGTTLPHELRIMEDIDINPKGRHILIVDDICDTGKSLEVVCAFMRKRDAASVSTCVLLDKPSRRKNAFYPDTIAFTIPNIWVQGRGMDTDEYGRGNPNVICGPYKA